jgi:AraC family ethanolamine operon transcriptional activator
MTPAPVREMHFAHGDEAAAAIPGIDVQFTVLSSSTRTWRLTEARVGDSMLVSGEMGAALCAVGVTDRDRLWFLVPLDASRWALNGQPFEARNIAALSEGTEHAAYLSQPIHWVSLQIPRVALQRKVGAHANIFIPRGLSFFEDDDFGQTPFRRAVEVALHFITTHPQAMAELDVQARLEKALLDALIGSLATPAPRDKSRSPLVVPRIEQYLHEHADEVLAPSDLCAAWSISERTLRRYFREAFQTSPGRFLRLRRLNQARRALRSGAFARVTEVGIRFGFFDLGRFAADYRELFGEFPSETLMHVRNSNSP